jgi:hypothetical protein
MNPLTSIWFSPRETVKSSDASDSSTLRFFLLWGWGAAYAYDRATSNATMASWPFSVQLIFPACVGLIGGCFYFYLVGFVIDVTSSWFRGRASFEQIRRALILGGIPKIASLMGYAALAVVFGPEMFGADAPAEMPLVTSIFYYLIVVGILGLSIWSMITMACALAEVQGYRSAWKAYLHMVVAFLLSTVALAVPLILWIYFISSK